MPCDPVTALIGKYEFMFCHIASLHYKFRESFLQKIIYGELLDVFHFNDDESILSSATGCGIMLGGSCHFSKAFGRNEKNRTFLMVKLVVQFF